MKKTMTIIAVVLFIVFSTLNTLLLINLGAMAVLKAIFAGAVQSAVLSAIIFIIILTGRKLFKLKAK